MQKLRCGSIDDNVRIGRWRPYRVVGRPTTTPFVGAGW